MHDAGRYMALVLPTTTSHACIKHGKLDVNSSRMTCSSCLVQTWHELIQALQAGRHGLLIRCKATAMQALSSADQVGNGDVLVGFALGADDIQDACTSLNVPHSLHAFTAYMRKHFTMHVSISAVCVHITFLPKVHILCHVHHCLHRDIFTTAASDILT